MYLQGIGDIRYASGREFHLQLQATLTDHRVNGMVGSYGIIDANTHILYETIPAPIISVLKMQADLMPVSPIDWDLPEALRPNLEAAQLPTENLLGWRRKERLSVDQRVTLEAGGITANDVFPRNIANIPIFQDLLKSVEDHIENSKCKVIATFPTSTTGSLAQVSFISRSPDDSEPEPLRNIAAKLGRTNSYTQAVSGIASSSAIMRYRIQRRTNHKIDSICYRSAAQAIPQPWLQNVNQIFHTSKFQNSMDEQIITRSRTEFEET
ncbi:uncharacterized protein LOC124307812 [Neodiprion virginianus]|uniref:uncharacterized protein LOC124307812 n=1 Tax=Neodiprion virginianus TaxID=2961670 RepID=UPI001EE722FC|nr:uncharacterized protein LOC124307812 [Neodiprion virginianus]